MGSRYLYEVAGRTGDTSVLPTAARLADTARGLEISALDVADVRRRTGPPKKKGLA
jgi:hypothetical protein